MASSIDGRLIADRWTKPAAGIAADIVSRHYEETASRFAADGWIVGRKTMEELVEGGDAASLAKPAEGDGDPRSTHVADRKDRAIAVAIDPSGKINYGRDNVGGDHVVAILGEQVSDACLAALRGEGVSYLFAGPDGRDLNLALNILGESFGAKTLLLEGGGGINGAFLKAGLIDEISLLIYPGIDGLAGMPSIFEYIGGENEMPAAGRSLRHLATETLEGGAVWLRYKVEEAPQ